ncbi:hypothetical protein [Aeromonas dhakensis]|uniref:hypothetical protein n=1 Tax=Aeromonas dhakensis TaxID=196024 RepID=UPI003BA1D55C
MIHISTFSKMFRASRICQQQGLDIPMLVLTYASIDTLAWAAFGNSIKSVRGRFVKLCDEYLINGGNIECTSLELYAARCSVVHTLGWESDLSLAGKAQSVFYSFGTDNPSLAQEAYEHSHPGKFVAIRADDLLDAVEACASDLASKAETDPELRARLYEATGKQYMSIESSVSDELFNKVIQQRRECRTE